MNEQPEAWSAGWVAAGSAASDAAIAQKETK